MRIKKISQNLMDMEISSERVDEIISDSRKSIEFIEVEIDKIKSMIVDLTAYRSTSLNGNDQIDDTISAYQMAVSNLEDTIDKLDTVINNLNDYNQRGRNYLYTGD